MEADHSIRCVSWHIDGVHTAPYEKCFENVFGPNWFKELKIIILTNVEWNAFNTLADVPNVKKMFNIIRADEWGDHGHAVLFDNTRFNLRFRLEKNFWNDWVFSLFKFKAYCI